MMEKRQPLQQILLGIPHICMRKTETRSMSLTCTSINLKWIKNLSRRLETTAGSSRKYTRTYKDFPSRTPMAQQIKEMMNK
jgi:protein tyrosine/serine phosphatase